MFTKRIIVTGVILAAIGGGVAYFTSVYVSTPTGIAEPTTENQGEIQHQPNYVDVKYRNDPVDIGDPRFEYVNTSKSSFVRGAWYDEDNQYMIIKLNSINYQYCGMPSSVWSSFSRASSFGSYYNANVKNNYDCRTYPAPIY